jgi:hypothetical protein
LQQDYNEMKSKDLNFSTHPERREWCSFRRPLQYPHQLHTTAKPSTSAKTLNSSCTNLPATLAEANSMRMIKWQNGTVITPDQTKLPLQEVTLEIKSVEQMA